MIKPGNLVYILPLPPLMFSYWRKEKEDYQGISLVVRVSKVKFNVFFTVITHKGEISTFPFHRVYGGKPITQNDIPEIIKTL